MKDIKGYEGLYAITSCGKVWSYKSKRFLKPRVVKDYFKVTLYKSGTGKEYFIHRLVAAAYIDNPLDLPDVNHKNERKADNYISNLEWISHEDNCNYGTRNQRAGEAHRKPVYCAELDKVFESQSAAAAELGINIGSINSCLKGRYKTAGGYHWSYYNATH